MKYLRVKLIKECLYLEQKINTETIKVLFLHLQELSNVISVATLVLTFFAVGSTTLFLETFLPRIYYILKPIFPTEYGMLSFPLYFT